MAFPLRIAVCLLLALLGMCGCRPFQPGSMSRLQQPLPTGDELANGRGRTLSRGNRESGNEYGSEYGSARSTNQSAASSTQHKLGDSPALTKTGNPPAEHSSEGYCASCGVTHGSSNGPPEFKFTQPLPQFQPASQPRLSSPASTNSSSQSNAEAIQLDATYSSAVRVRPLQPEEARVAHGIGTRPAPPPQPDDGPEPAAAESLAAATAGSASATAPATDATYVAATTKSPQSGPSNSDVAKSSEPEPREEQRDSTMKLTAETKLGSSPSATVALTAAEEPATVPATDSATCEAGEAPCPNLADLQQTLVALRKQADQVVATDLGTKLESELAALELLAGRIEQLAAGEADATQAQKSCQHQIAALVSTLSPDALDISRPEGRTAATATLEHLRAAIAQLESLVSLKVTRGALCSEIRGFGQYKPFAGTEFRAGQSVLLYCELENFCSTPKTEASEPGYCTRLKSSLVICREDGTVAQQAEFPVVEDLARNRRRDFYLYVPFTVGELTPGKYRAHLLVDDLLGCKQAVLDPPVEFMVR